MAVSYGTPLALGHLAESLNGSTPKVELIRVETSRRMDLVAPPVRGTSDTPDRFDPFDASFHYPHNPGYLNGAMLGLEAAEAESGRATWTAISNADIRLVSEVPAVVSRLREVDEVDVGVVAPSVLDVHSGKDANPYLLRRPELASDLLRLLSLLAPDRARGRFARRQTSPNRPKGDPIEIWAPHGSFFIMHRRLLDEVGPLVHPQFLYGEEETVRAAADRSRLRILYDPSILSLHASGTSTGNMSVPRRRLYSARAIVRRMTMPRDRTAKRRVR